MRIIVCVKQVPDTTEVRINPETGTLIREGVPSILNPDDANALEAALSIKDANKDTVVTVLTMGPPQADDMLRECLAMGADEAFLISDRAFAGSDTWATSNALSSAIRKIGDYDIIFAGRQAIDGDTAQVGPQIAEKLDISQITYVQDFEVKEDSIKVHRQLEDGHEVLEAKTPILLTAVKELNTPRYMSVEGIFDAYEKDVTVWSIDDLDVAKEEVGLKASPTRVARSFVPQASTEGIRLEGDTVEVVENLVANLKERHII